MLLDECIEMAVCRNPVVKSGLVERFKITLKSNLYNRFTWKNTTILGRAKQVRHKLQGCGALDHRECPIHNRPPNGHCVLVNVH